MNSWKRSGLVLLLVAAFALPAWAEAPNSDGKSDDLKEIRKQLGEIRDILKRMDAQEERIRKLEQRIADLLQERSAPPVVSRRESNYPQPNVPDRALAGTIFMRNDSGRRAILFVNGNPYPIEPGQTATLRDLPLAPFTYEVTMEGTTRTFGPVRRTFDAARVYSGVITADLIP